MATLEQVQALGFSSIEEANDMYAYTACQAELGCPIEPGMLFRQTPCGQRNVSQLLGQGTRISTSYGTGPYRVESIRRVAVMGFETYSLVCSSEERSGHYYLNELVAVDGRIRHLFGNNDDEVFVHGGGQLGLF